MNARSAKTTSPATAKVARVRKPRVAKVVEAVVVAVTGKTPAVQCSQFIVKKNRVCNMMTHHAEGICTDHRAVWAPVGKNAKTRVV